MNQQEIDKLRRLKKQRDNEAVRRCLDDHPAESNR